MADPIKENTFNIELTPTGPELVIRQGAAAKLYDPVPLKLAGTIEAPGDFFTNRIQYVAEIGNARDIMHQVDSVNFLPDAYYQAPTRATSHVLADYTARTITLRWNERDQFADEVKGVLRLHPALEALTINAQKTYSHRGLLALLKFQGAYFASREDHDTLIAKLKAFETKVVQEFKDADDYKGTAGQSKLTKITHAIPLEFKLTMPIFGGGEKATFTVDICVGLVSGSVDFWLESTKLEEMIVTATETIFERELGRFPGVVLIKQFPAH